MFIFEMVAVKVTVNVSAGLLVFEYQSTILVVELNVINVVLPPNEPATVI